MTPKEQLIATMERKQPLGRVPHFELVFFLTMEVFGRVHPKHRIFDQWDQMSKNEREVQMRDIADLYVTIAQKYEHSAIFVQAPGPYENIRQQEQMMKMIMEEICDISGNDYCLIMHGDATHGILGGEAFMEFSHRIADDPQGLKDEAKHMVESALKKARILQEHGVLDGFALCSDYCLNRGPFISPSMFDDFVTPYLAELIAGYREMGFYVIKHTDGNIMPILDSLISTNPDVLHSLDPQAGVDIAEVKKKAGDKVCLMGNVNCGLLNTGTDEQIIESARYSLKHGKPGGGYIFSTSNCIYTGMDVKKYDLILDIWREEGNYE